MSNEQLQRDGLAGPYELADTSGLDVWRTNFFVKSDGAGQNKWHHDRHFENGNEPIDLFDTGNHFSILVALTDVGMDSGRIEYVKGSHSPIEGWDRDIPRHIRDVPEVVQDRVTPLPLKQGQFVLFHSTLLACAASSIRSAGIRSTPNTLGTIPSWTSWSACWDQTCATTTTS